MAFVLGRAGSVKWGGVALSGVRDVRVNMGTSLADAASRDSIFRGQEVALMEFSVEVTMVVDFAGSFGTIKADYLSGAKKTLEVLDQTAGNGFNADCYISDISYDQGLEAVQEARVTFTLAGGATVTAI